MATMTESMMKAIDSERERDALIEALEFKIIGLGSQWGKVIGGQIQVTHWIARDDIHKRDAIDTLTNLKKLEGILRLEQEDLIAQKRILESGSGFVTTCSGCGDSRVFSGLPDEGLRDWWWEAERDVWSCPKCHAVHDSQPPPGES